MALEQNTLTYAICNVVTDLPHINYNEVVETSAQSIRKSVDGILFIIKWTTEPEFITDGTVTPSAVINNWDAANLMNTPEWQCLPG